MGNIAVLRPKTGWIILLALCGTLLGVGCGRREKGEAPPKEETPPAESVAPGEPKIGLARRTMLDPRTFQQDPRVTLILEAFDSRGQPLSLAPSQIRIQEDGREIPHDQIHFASGPVSVILLLDTSGSMAQRSKPDPFSPRKIEAARGAARQLLAKLQPDDKMGIVTFDNDFRVTQALTKDRNLLEDAIRQTDVPPRPTQTAYFAAIDYALELLRKVPGRRSVIAFTDGYDNLSRQKYNIDLRSIEQKSNLLGIPVIALGYGDATVDIPKAEARRDYAALRRAIDLPTLQQLATTTGGVTLQTLEPEKLNALFEEAAKQARGRFPLTYLSSNPQTGKPHKVTLTVSYQGKQYQMNTVYAVGFLGGEGSWAAAAPVGEGRLWRLFFVGLTGIVLLRLLPPMVRELLWQRRKTTLYAHHRVGPNDPARPGERSPISAVSFSRYPDEPCIRCPRCGLRHFVRDWEMNEGCARGDYVMRREAGLTFGLQAYYGALLGGLGGLLAWLASWLPLSHSLARADVTLASSILTVTLGILIGLFVSGIGAVFQQAVQRFFTEGAIGVMLGAFAGLLGALLGELLFQGLFLFSRSEWLGRFLSWAVMGMLVGVAQGLYVRQFAAVRSLRGLVGGFIGGGLGGLVFQWAMNTYDSPVIARLAFVAVGILIGLAITISLNMGRFWLVREQGNTNLKEFHLDPGVRQILLGFEPTRCHLLIKNAQEAAPIHALITYDGAFVIEDRSGAYQRPDGTPFPPLLINGSARARHRLEPEDRIHIGNTVLKLELRDSSTSGGRKPS